MNAQAAPLDLVSWLHDELEAQRAEIERDFANVRSGEVVLDVNLTTQQVAVKTRVTRTYVRRRTTDAA